LPDLWGPRKLVAVSSGTDADILALAVLYDFGAKRGDEIIIPALSFVASGNAVLHAGFKPVFVDIERETLNIDPSKIEKAITKKTKAIMPVHLMGKPAKMDSICKIAKNITFLSSRMQQKRMAQNTRAGILVNGVIWLHTAFILRILLRRRRRHSYN